MAHPLLEALAQAYFRKHRRRLGITEEDRADRAEQIQAQAAGTNDVLKQAQLARILQQLQLAPELAESQTALRQAQAEAAQARANAAPKTPHIAAGSFEDYLAADPKRRAEIEAARRRYGQADDRDGIGRRKRLPIRVLEFDPVKRKNVLRWYDPDSLEPIRETEPGLPAAESKQVGIVGSVADAVKTMRELVPSAEVGGPEMLKPLTGGISRLKAEVTREGDPAEFDYAAQRSKDMVYFKTGAQLNETEQRQLERMVPNRARGNLAAQVERYEQYVRTLFKKYGIEDDLNEAGDTVSDLPGGGWDQAAASASAPAAGAVEFVRDPATGRLVRKR